MDGMFAPYCHTCGQRVLLGPRRIVRTDAHRPGGGQILLRCVCGSLVRHDEPVPRQDQDAGNPPPRVA